MAKALTNAQGLIELSHDCYITNSYLVKSDKSSSERCETYHPLLFQHKTGCYELGKEGAITGWQLSRMWVQKQYNVVV